MNAYEYYLSTCKYVLFADPSNKNTWIDLYSYLPCLRQMLSCCVCGNIMLKPKGPSHRICLHHVCSSCIGGKMRLRPVCSWCRTHEGFVDNPGMRLLVLCFKKMCVFISNSSIGKQIRKAAANGAHTNTLIRVLDEAVAFEDDYVISSKVMPTCVPTYGMAPEPKLVSFPRGPQIYPTGCTVSSVVTGAGSDCAVSPHTGHGAPDCPPSLTTVQSDNRKAADKKLCSASSRNGDELNETPAQLAPTARGNITQEKLSPPHAETERADNADHQDQWTVVTRSGQVHGEQFHPPPTGTAPDDSNITPDQKPQKMLLKTKLKRTFVAPENTVRGKYQRKNIFKQDLGFEPPCKRTRLASSLSMISTATARKTCPCARLTPPSPHTGFGQRCPCDSDQQSCVNCVCDGSCHNPQRDPVLYRNGDVEKSDSELESPMPILSPQSKQ